MIRVQAAYVAKFTKIFERKKKMCLNRLEMLWNTQKCKKKFYPFDPLRAKRVAPSPIDEAQPYLLHVTRRVQRSVHAKFHADRTKTVVRRGISYILRVAQSPSGEAQLYLSQVTPRVPRSVHAKFHANRTKTVVRRGILIYWIHTPAVDGVLTYSIDICAISVVGLTTDLHTERCTAISTCLCWTFQP